MSDRDRTRPNAKTSPVEVSRRAALHALGLGVAAAGCGGAATSPSPASEIAPQTPAAGTATAAPPGIEPGPPTPTPTTPQAEDLLAGIDHIVVLMMENRSFDHFLGSLAKDAGYPGQKVVAGLSGSESNPAPDGSSVPCFRMENFTPADPPHSWEAAHAQYAEGTNSGFVKAHEGDAQNEVMGYHDRSQIPLYYWFADNFTVCDAWHASVLGPTWPNRYFLHAATSKGKTDNTPFFTGAPDTIWDRLEAAGKTYKNYAAGVSTWYVGGFVGKVLKRNPSAPIGQFFEAAKTGALPAFSLIDPDFAASDDHPSHNILRGQAFVASVYKALAESPAWSRTLLIVTYDEHGGFYDHVPPPAVADPDPAFGRLGFRVPAFLIGPTVKKGHVCKTLLEHASVAATLGKRFQIKSLGPRMDGANDVSDAIDPAKIKAPAKPPAGMPQVAMSLQTALTDGVGPSSQPALEALVRRGLAPTVDDRDDRQRIGDWLEHAVRLGAVRIVGR